MPIILGGRPGCTVAALRKIGEYAEGVIGHQRLECLPRRACRERVGVRGVSRAHSSHKWQEMADFSLTRKLRSAYLPNSPRKRAEGKWTRCRYFYGSGSPRGDRMPGLSQRRTKLTGKRTTVPGAFQELGAKEYAADGQKDREATAD